jgi:hypothetical protein
MHKPKLNEAYENKLREYGIDPYLKLKPTLGFEWYEDFISKENNEFKSSNDSKRI